MASGFKLFTDASWSATTHTGGKGFILIDEANTPVLAGHAAITADNAEQAEGECVPWAINLSVVKIKGKEVRLFTDCLNVVSFLRDPLAGTQWCTASLLLPCLSLCNKLANFSFYWISRSGNFISHELAALGNSHCEVYDAKTMPGWIPTASCSSMPPIPSFECILLLDAISFLLSRRQGLPHTQFYILVSNLLCSRKKKMTVSPLNPKTPSHTRSISLPTRSHPLTLTVEEQICRLRSSEATSSSSTSSSVCNNLSGLKELYDRVDNLLQLPLTQQAVSHEGSNKCVNDIFDGSLRILDVCGSTRDILSQTKEAVQDLQSCLRRRNCVSNDVNTYKISRKKMNKVILKCLADMKRSKSSFVLEKDPNIVAIVGILREVEDIAISIFESLLSHVSRPRVRSKTNNWSLVSKMMRSRNVSSQGEDAEISEMEKVDITLSTLTNDKSCKAVDVHNVQKQLEKLESSTQGLEGALECVFRSLIKTRVSLLNILSH
ncbi:hypothetical protein GIB67_006986 [Kingdonia uniflora]|uniref:RNase H type-1 domain-containing protein n=1 Tax=Kingdonia uniflora TaxID=39325 RepID=A0A7J7NZF5_9MAGN|nr:hypothetical protein GIB67_006986 [Kingdonia uniflora]